MNITEAHYHFDLLYNKIDSAHKRDLNPAEKDELLNKAMDIWIEQTYSGFNSKQVGFENTQQRIDDLSPLVVKCPSNIQSILLPKQLLIKNVYEFSLRDLKFDYLHMIRVIANATNSNNCVKQLEVHIIQHDDLTKILNDTYRRPDFNWGRAVGVYGRGTTTSSVASPQDVSLYIYGQSDFTITSLCPEYIKRPERVSIGGYVGIDGNTKAQVDFDLPPRVVHQIVDLAVREGHRMLLDPEGFQLYGNLHNDDE